MTYEYNCLNCRILCISDNHRKKNKFCKDTRCQQAFQNAERVSKWKKTGNTGRKSISGTPPWLKKYILDKQDGKCLKCGIDSWQGSPIVLELEHIDGNSDNNFEENLCCLCPNCHSQTPTYRAKNKGNGRSFRNK
jgi:hypothetical protein